ERRLYFIARDLHLWRTTGVFNPQDQKPRPIFRWVLLARETVRVLRREAAGGSDMCFVAAEAPLFMDASNWIESSDLELFACPNTLSWATLMASVSSSSILAFFSAAVRPLLQPPQQRCPTVRVAGLPPTIT